MVTTDDIIVDTIAVTNIEQYVAVSFGMQSRNGDLHQLIGYMSEDQAFELQRKLEPFTYKPGYDPEVIGSIADRHDDHSEFP